MWVLLVWRAVAERLLALALAGRLVPLSAPDKWPALLRGASMAPAPMLLELLPLLLELHGPKEAISSPMSPLATAHRQLFVVTASQVSVFWPLSYLYRLCLCRLAGHS